MILESYKAHTACTSRIMTKPTASIPFEIAANMAYSISSDQRAFFEKNGYLILKDVLSSDETIKLQKWAQEVHDLPRTEDTPWMPYEEVNKSGKSVLCRTENYANYHADFNGLLRGEKILGILCQLAGEDMLLFKEKSTFQDTEGGRWLQLTKRHSQL